MPIEMQTSAHQYLSTLIARKDKLFSQYQWFIVAFNAEEHAGEIRLRVAACELNPTNPPTIK
jgi:hypothetical protein